MKRGIFVVLAVLAATFVTPAQAAPSKTVVYEVVRGAGAPEKSYVVLKHLPGSGTSVIMAALLEPSGTGYEMRAVAGSTDDSGGSGEWATGLTLGKGARFLVGGDRGRFRVITLTRGWSVREIGSGFRHVAAGDGATSAGGVDVVNGTSSVPAGPYGSLAFAAVPCEPGVGRWTLRSDAGEAASLLCHPLTFADNVVETRAGRTWSVDAQVAGFRGWEYRLLVLDYPKRPAR